MIVQYKPNEKDQPILDDITANIRASLDRWYGTGSNLDSDMPEIRSYRNSFILRYSVTTPGAQRKHILAKIRRNPKMDSLSRAIQADIHQNMENEYRTLNLLFDNFNSTEEDFGAIRPLAYLDQYPALVMEEYPARTLRQLVSGQRNSKTDWYSSELRDAARKTGQWLRGAPAPAGSAPRPTNRLRHRRKARRAVEKGQYPSKRAKERVMSSTHCAFHQARSGLLSR